MEKREGKKKSRLSASFKVGAIALTFLIIGYESALFVREAAVSRMESNRDHPDTVYVVDSAFARSLMEKSPLPHSGNIEVRKYSGSPGVISRVSPRTFPFNPNTVTLEELCLLGFSRSQAQVIINYREKGGRFSRKEDFRKSYVVSDSIYRRLESSIVIPMIDINEADSAAFDALPGIGPYFAAKLVAYRSRLGGFSYIGQMMDIKGFDREKFEALSDLVEAGPCDPYPLWQLPEKELEKHPYIGKYSAHGIVLFRENTNPEQCTVEALEKNGILDAENAAKLAACRIALPTGIRE